MKGKVEEERGDGTAQGRGRKEGKDQDWGRLQVGIGDMNDK